MLPIVALFFLAFGWAAAAQDTVIGRASVVDGDRLEVKGIRIRLFGNDAPESFQICTRDHIAYRCGQRAAFALADKIGVHPLSVRAATRIGMGGWWRFAGPGVKTSAPGWSSRGTPSPFGAIRWPMCRRKTLRGSHGAASGPATSSGLRIIAA
jgi:hypothetical protein